MPTRTGRLTVGVWSALCLAVLAGSFARAQTTTPAPATAPTAKPVPPPRPDPQRAAEAYLAGARLLDRNELDEAQAAFARAAALDPEHQEYFLALALARERRISNLIQRAAQARMGNRTAQADALLAEAAAIDPSNQLVLQHAPVGPAELLLPTKAGAQFKPSEVAYAPPIAIKPTAARLDLHLRGEARSVVTQAAAAYGVKTVFDESATSSPLRFDLEQSPYDEAMPILLRMAHLFGVPLDAKTLFIAKDTEENRQKLERQVEETIYIPASTPEQLNELSNIVKNVFDVKQVVVAAGSGTLLIRAPEPTLKALNYTLADMLDGGAEVLLDVKLVSIDKSLSRNTGASTPTSAGFFSVAAEARSIVSANQTLINTAISSGAIVPTGNASADTLTEAIYLILSGLATDAKVSNLFAIAGKGLTLTGFYLGSGGTFNLALSSSDARALDDLSIRVDDGKEAILRVGERYPITVSTYSSGLSSATSSALAGATINGVSASSLLSQYLNAASVATVPVIQYEDLGITLKTTPSVRRSGLISMHIDLKIEALTGTSANNIPVLTSSNFVSDITVQEGMTAVMMTQLSSTESASISGLPGLAELPGFQETLANANKSKSESELVLLITPHLVRRRSASMASQRIRFSSSVPADY